MGTEATERDLAIAVRDAEIKAANLNYQFACDKLASCKRAQAKSNAVKSELRRDLAICMRALERRCPAENPLHRYAAVAGWLAEARAEWCPDKDCE